jgi:hypothetical protein
MKMVYRELALSMAAASVLMLTACGGGSSSSTSPTAVDYNGKFLDSAVGGVSYVCSTKSGTTAADGSFGTCPAGSTVTFSIDGLTLGSSAVTDDNIFFVTDIVGVARTDIGNEEVLKIAVLLQSLDSDGDVSNGISIPSEAAATIESLLSGSTNVDSISDLSLAAVTTLATSAVNELSTTYPDMVLVLATEAEANLADTLEDIENGAITGSEGS